MSQSTRSLQEQSGMMVHVWLQPEELKQDRQCERPDVLAKVPIGQQLHTLLSEAPTTRLDLPAGHGVQAEARETLL